MKILQIIKDLDNWYSDRKTKKWYIWTLNIFANFTFYTDTHTQTPTWWKVFGRTKEEIKHFFLFKMFFSFSEELKKVVNKSTSFVEYVGYHGRLIVLGHSVFDQAKIFSTPPWSVCVCVCVCVLTIAPVAIIINVSIWYTW